MFFSSKLLYSLKDLQNLMLSRRSFVANGCVKEREKENSLAPFFVCSLDTAICVPVKMEPKREGIVGIEGNHKENCPRRLSRPSSLGRFMLQIVQIVTMTARSVDDEIPQSMWLKSHTSFREKPALGGILFIMERSIYTNASLRWRHESALRVMSKDGIR
jgi:hypothetical protein